MGDSDGGIDVDDARSRAVSGPATGMTIAAAVFTGVGGILIGTLFFQFLDAYFTIWTPAVVTDGDVRRYEVTASVCIIALVLAVVLAALGRQAGLAVVAGLLCVVALAVALLFAVPQGRWTPVERQQPLPSDYQPCFSGSDDCVGG